MNVSYHLDMQSGPTIVLTSATLFAAVLAFTSLRAAGRRHAGVAS